MKRPGSGQLKRILFLSRGGQIDGAQRQLCYLVRGLDRSRYEPVVLLDQSGPLADHLHRMGVDVQVTPMRAWRSFPAGLLRYADAFRIARLGRRRGVDLVHASDVWRSGYLHFASRWLAAPGVLHVRGPICPRDVAKHRLARASAVVAIAQRYQQDLLAAGIEPGRVTLIEDAVDLERFRPGLAGREYLQRSLGVDGQVLVGIVGRVDPFKRVLEFLDVIAPLAGKGGRRVSYLVIGQPGPAPEYCQAVRDAAERLGLARHVVFTGRREDMPEVMAALDIVVTMSGGSTMFEAMACAKPVLSVRTDGRHSLHTRHGETAWCVTAADRPEPATEALARLIDDADLRRQLGEAARTWAERHLSIDVLAARTQALYERLIRERA